MAWLSRILAPVAFCSSDRGATQYAETLACHFHSELLLLHVVPPPLGAFSSPEAAAYITAVEVAAEKLQQSKADLARYFDAGSPPVPLTEDVLPGDPSREIVEYARGHGVDLIVMATHGYGPLRRMLLGSVTADVVRHAVCPVLTGAHLEAAPDYASIAFRKILCAIDLEQNSRAVLGWAAAFAREFGAGLSILHVLPHSVVEVGGIYFDPIWRQMAVDQALDQIHQLQLETGAEGEVLIEIGDTAAAVADAAAECGADLLVIGRGCGRGLASRLRSPAYSILREAPCPVATV